MVPSEEPPPRVPDSGGPPPAGSGRSRAPQAPGNDSLQAGDPREAPPRVNTLLSLLGDDSPQVEASVRAAFQRLGKSARPDLKRAARSGRPELRGRARQMLLERERMLAVRRLVRYASRPKHDLETALLMLDGHHSPGADLRAYRRVLDMFGETLREQVGRVPIGRRRVQAMVDYLAGELDFTGAAEDYHHPDNICLHRTIDRRRGMPLTLAAVYASVGRRAGLQVDLLPFPGHVLVLVREGGDRIVLDPFGGGAFLSEEKCLAYLAVHRLPHRQEFLEPASATAMFLRQVLNLIQSCKLRQRFQEANALEQVLHVLSHHSAVARQAPKAKR